MGRWAIAMGMLLGQMVWLPAASAVDGVGLELGSGDESAQRAGVTARWDWDSRWFTAGEWVLGGYWEAALGHWRGDGDRGETITTIGVTPVFRLQRRVANGAGTPFLELGAGVQFLSDRFMGDREFATRWNFGSHLGAGALFGGRDQYELSYRFQHISNADIKKPNPGINFHLVRFNYRY